MNISDEAIEAAAKALALGGFYSEQEWDEITLDKKKEPFRKHARIALEAAAPFIASQPQRRTIATPGELNTLRLNTIIRDAEGLPLHKDDSDRIEEWCYGDNAVDVDLPAIVIWEPEV